MTTNEDVIRAVTESGTDWIQVITAVVVVLAVIYALRLLRAIARNLKLIAEGVMSAQLRELVRIRIAEEKRRG